MISIEKYMNDGANWQAQCVLAYVRAFKSSAVEETWNDEFKKYDADIIVGRFENCREQGYVISVQYKYYDKMNYVVYEHRNSDDICVVVFDKPTLNTPTLDDFVEVMGDSSYNYTKSFLCGQIEKCGDYILEDMRAFLKEVMERKANKKSNK